jgi:negative regulator of sigma E activity
MAKDSLSALIDGECTPAELERILDEMEQSPAIKSAWSRLWLARDAGEGVRVRKDQPCICAGVMAQLGAQDAQPAGRKVVPLTSARRRSGLRTYWKPLAGLAAAASVAAVMVTLAPQREAGPASIPGFAPQIGTPVGVPAAQPRPGMQHLVSAEDELRRYLIEHSNTLADRGMGATLSYARFAAHSVGEPGLQPVSFDPSGDQP